jgi:hypothetical protein
MFYYTYILTFIDKIATVIEAIWLYYLATLTN